MPARTPETRDRATAEGRRIQAQIAKASGSPFVKVGFPSKDFDKKKKRRLADGSIVEDPVLTTGQVAVFHEYGTEDVPARPFMQITYDRNVLRMRTLLASELSLVSSGQSTIERSLKKAGVVYVGMTRETILSNLPPPNDPDTIVRKLKRGGFKIEAGHVEGGAMAKDTTLVDTSQMMQTVSSEYVPKGRFA